MTAFHSSSWIVITERKWIVLLGIIETREVLHTMSSLEGGDPPARLYSLVLFPQNRVKGGKRTANFEYVEIGLLTDLLAGW